MRVNGLLFVSLALCSSASAQGTVIDDSFFSPALGVSKNYRVYLPAGYASDDRRFPAIYLLHGWSVTERAWTETLHVDEVADRIGLQAIIVMPDGDRSLYANAVAEVDYEACLKEEKPNRNPTEPRESFCVRTPRYEDYIVDDLRSEIDAKFKTVPTRLGRALSGESAGGNGALALALRNPHLFSSAASHSGALALLYEMPHPFETGQAQFASSVSAETGGSELWAILGDDIENWKAHDSYFLVADDSRVDIALYFDAGSEDEFDFDDLAAAFHELLVSKAIEHEYHQVPGRHDDELFAKRIEFSLRFHSLQFGKNGLHPFKSN